MYKRASRAKIEDWDCILHPSKCLTGMNWGDALRNADSQCSLVYFVPVSVHLSLLSGCNNSLR